MLEFLHIKGKRVSRRSLIDDDLTNIDHCPKTKCYKTDKKMTLVGQD